MINLGLDVHKDSITIAVLPALITWSHLHHAALPIAKHVPLTQPSHINALLLPRLFRTAALAGSRIAHELARANASGTVGVGGRCLHQIGSGGEVRDVE